MVSDSEGDFLLNIDIRAPHRLKTRAPPKTCHRLQPAAGASMADKRARRAHSQMDLEGTSSPNWGHPSSHLHNPFTQHDHNHNHNHNHTQEGLAPSRPNVSGLHLPPFSNMAPPPQRRFAGDGFDYRRPISSTRPFPAEPDIIDLTSDDASGPSASEAQSRPASAAPLRPTHATRNVPPQRGPRFGRDIMVISDSEDAVEDRSHQAPAPPGSPEVQFVRSRRRTPPAARPPVIDVDDYEPEPDDVEITAERRDFGIHSIFGRVGGWAMMDAIHRHTHHFGYQPAPPPRNNEGDRAGFRQFGGYHINRAPIPHIGLDLGIDMDYDVVGFDMDTGERPAQPAPTYNAPPPAPEGFTRSPDEEGALACPNCGEELCVGESELQKQVWIVKACGHVWAPVISVFSLLTPQQVYCGECTSARYVGKSAKGKEKAISAPAVHRPFKECVVQGCSKKTSHRRAMIQVFL